MVALSVILGMIKIWTAPFGGSVTLFSMVPLIVIAFRRGAVWGMAGGFVSGVLNLLFDLGTLAYIPTPAGIIACILLDYLIAYTLLGTAGIFHGGASGGGALKRFSVIAAGVILAVSARFLCHLVSGAVIWYDLTKLWYPDDPSNIVNRYGPWIYSALYNGAFMLPELAMTLLAAPIITRLLSIIGYRSDKA